MLNRLRAVRDRLFADPGFRRGVAALPVGRQVSERHARRLFGIVTGFAQSQMLAGGLESGAFDLLAKGPASAAALTRALPLPAAGCAALLRALVALGLVEARGDAFALTIDGLVVATDPGIRAMVAHNALPYRDLADPLAMLTAPGSGALGAFWPYAGGGGDAGGYAALMAASLGFVADAVSAAVDVAKIGSLVDLGGGDGAFLGTVAARSSRPALTLVDLPAMVPVARERLAARGLGDRIAVAERGAGPTGVDAVTLIRVLHDADDDAALALLAEAAGMLRRGGRLILAEPLARTGRDAQTVYFTAYFAAMGSGRLRTFGEVKALLARAGFRSVARSRSFLADVIQAEQSKA